MALNVSVMNQKRPEWIHDADVYAVASAQRMRPAEGFSDGERVFLPSGARRFHANRGVMSTGNWTHLAIIHSSEIPQSAQLPEDQQYVLDVARRILERGVVPPLSEFVSVAMRAVTLVSERVPAAVPHWRSPDNSELEELFLKRLINTLDPREVLFFLHFQVPFTILVPGAEEDLRRVDFAFFQPTAHPRAIVIEIDGEHHSGSSQQLETDLQRDHLLRQNGHIVFRLTRKDLESDTGEAFAAVCDAIVKSRFPQNWDEEASAAAHARTALLYAIERGVLSPEDSEWIIRCSGSWVETQARSLSEFIQVLGAIGELYNTRFVPNTVQVRHDNGNDTTPGAELLLHWSPLPWFYPATNLGDHSSARCAFELRPAWFPFVATLPASPRVWRQPDPTVSRESLEYLLRVSFPGLAAFRPGQEEAIRRSLAGQDSVVLLPTGAGKSLVFQFSALLLPGVTLVVAPLISLMQDQVENLRYFGFDRSSAISSQDTDTRRHDLMERLKAGIFMICYISPERLQQQPFRDSLALLKTAGPIPQIVVDEAHCVSEWGHDFRPAYLNLGRLSRLLGRRGPGVVPSLIGLTGTASRAVLRDVQRELGIQDLEAVITPKSFDRTELSFEVVSIDEPQKQKTVTNLLERTIPQRLGIGTGDLFTSNGEQSACGIIFYPHVGHIHGIIEAKKQLEKHFKTNVAAFGGSDKIDQNEKQKDVQRFKSNECTVMVATKAFGMGIDKPNVRYTVHYQLPQSLESFYQEAGRAGRNRQPAHCMVVSTVHSSEQAEFLLAPGISNDEARDRYRTVEQDWDCKDDIVRNLFFFFSAFPGITVELSSVRQVVSALGDLQRVSEQSIPFSRTENGRRNGTTTDGDLSRKDLERVLHRLILLGIVSDYTVDHVRGTLNVKTNAVDSDSIREHLFQYISGYSISRARRVMENLPVDSVRTIQESILVYVQALIEFIYVTVEGGRRNAIRTVWRWADPTKSDSQLRKELLDYLQETESAKSVFAILRDDEFNLEMWSDVVAYVASIKEAQELNTALSRALEDYPDHPAVLACRSLAVAMSGKSPIETCDYIDAAIEFLIGRYGEGAPSAEELFRWALDEARVHREVDISALLWGATRITEAGVGEAQQSASVRAALARDMLGERLTRENTFALLPTLLGDLRRNVTDLLAPDLEIHGGNNE